MVDRINTNTSFIYSGNGVPFERTDSNFGNIIANMFSNSATSVRKDILNTKNLKNVFYKTSPEYKKNFQEELQHILDYAFNNRGGIDDTLFSLFVHQTVSLFPFAYPDEGFEINIPVQTGNGWEMKSYTLESKFPLASNYLASPMPAYGFLSNDGGPPMLVFMGTTYPAGKGFLGTLLSDFTPGHSVGALALSNSQDEIKQWLQVNSGAYVMGMSLGGALSLHAANLFKNNIAKVFATVPPGFYQDELKTFNNTSSDIHILFHDGDFVSNLGYFPEQDNVHLYKAHEEKRANPFSAHARVLLSGKNIKLSQESILEENKRKSRHTLTKLHKLFSPAIFASILPAYIASSFFKMVKRVLSTTHLTGFFKLRVNDVEIFKV